MISRSPDNFFKILIKFVRVMPLSNVDILNQQADNWGVVFKNTFLVNLLLLSGLIQQMTPFTPLWANSADDTHRLVIFFHIFPRKQDLTLKAN